MKLAEIVAIFVVIALVVTSSAVVFDLGKYIIDTKINSMNENFEEKSVINYSNKLVGIAENESGGGNTFTGKIYFSGDKLNYNMSTGYKYFCSLTGDITNCKINLSKNNNVYHYEK